MNKDIIRVACIGDSITFGYGLPDREVQSYPSCLQGLLGKGFEVINYGANGASVLVVTGHPYGKTFEFQEMSESYADIYIIELGANDLLPGYIDRYEEAFIKDYGDLISLLKKEVGNPMIFITSLTPQRRKTLPEQDFLTEWFDRLQGIIARIARDNSVGLIDIYSPLASAMEESENLIPDGVHPGPEGAEIIAHTIFRALYPTGE